MDQPRAAVDWLFRNRQTGRLTALQPPNPAIVVWFACFVGRRVDALSERADDLRWAGAGALIVWGLDEVVRGVNPFRRIVGASVLAWQVWQVVS